MKKLKIIEALCLLLLFSGCVAAAHLKTSIIIPCHVKHVNHLYDLLQIYTQQTVLPDEIVISISQAATMDPGVTATIRNTQWPFEVKVLVSNNVQYPGINRNVACNNAVGDIFILNDADDIPHPQRNEIILYAFEHYRCDHLAHRYIWVSENTVVENFFRKYVPNELRYVNPSNYQGAWNMAIHNGNVSITPKVFAQIKWLSLKDASDDVVFNREVYGRFGNRIVADVQLLLYRNYLSSLRGSCELNLYDQYKTMLELNGFEVRNY